MILRLPTTADVFGYLHRRANHIDSRHSFFVRTIIDCNHLEDDSGCSVDCSIPGTLSEHSVLLVLSLSLSLSLSPAALIPVLVLQCIDTDTDTEPWRYTNYLLTYLLTYLMARSHKRLIVINSTLRAVAFEPNGSSFATYFSTHYNQIWCENISLLNGSSCTFSGNSPYCGDTVWRCSCLCVSMCCRL